MNGYCRITLFNHQIDLPQVPLYEDVDLHLIPDLARQVLEVRVWWDQKMVLSTSLPLAETTVRF